MKRSKRSKAKLFVTSQESTRSAKKLEPYKLEARWSYKFHLHLLCNLHYLYDFKILLNERCILNLKSACRFIDIFVLPKLNSRYFKHFVYLQTSFSWPTLQVKSTDIIAR